VVRAELLLAESGQLCLLEAEAELTALSLPQLSAAVSETQSRTDVTSSAQTPVPRNSVSVKSTSHTKLDESVTAYSNENYTVNHKKT